MKAWYFSTIDKKLRYGDDREIAIGVTHEIERTPRLCEQGLHGSRLLLDALSYAPGPVIWRVELSGEMHRGADKTAAQKRTYLAGGIDITHILWKFARLCALDVIHLWDAPDVVIQFLKTGDESLRAAAGDASWDAKDASLDAFWPAKDAFWAAKDASWAASWDTWAAVWDAARRASRASRDANRDTAYAARIKQNLRLTAMVSRAIKEAT